MFTTKSQEPLRHPTTGQFIRQDDLGNRGEANPEVQMVDLSAGSSPEAFQRPDLGTTDANHQRPVASWSEFVQPVEPEGDGESDADE
jgi:hypothetical protein